MRRRRRSDQRLRIALTVGTLGVGGTETQLCRLARELTARGHEVRVYALLEGGPLEAQLTGDGIEFEIVQFPGFWYRYPDGRLAPRQVMHAFGTLFGFWRAMWSFKPHVCHAYLPLSYMLTMPGAAIGRVPVRVTARRSLPSTTPLSPRQQLAHRLSTALAHAVFANSDAVARDTCEVEPKACKKIHVVVNGVELPTDTSAVDAEPPTAVVVANLISYKGHDDLIDALSSMSKPPLVRLVGDGPERDRLEKRAREAGLLDVEFLGRVRDASGVLHESQFAIHPSHEEGMPNAVLEEMAFGLPVVATQVGGVVQLIEDGISGVLVPAHDSQALAGAICRVMGDAELRGRLGSAARARATEFSWAACAENHLQLYRTLLQSPRNGGRV